jgi:hypothetical protein
VLTVVLLAAFPAALAAVIGGGPLRGRPRVGSLVDGTGAASLLFGGWAVRRPVPTVGRLATGCKLAGGGRGRALIYSDVLQNQGGAGFEERGEIPGEANMAPNTVKVVNETTYDVEHKCAVADGLTKISQHICHVLEAVALLRDGQVTLVEVTKLGIEVEGASLLVAEELVLECEPDGASGGVTGHDGLLQVGGDGVGDPRLDDVVRAVPIREGGCRGFLEDMVLQGVLPNDE